MISYYHIIYEVGIIMVILSEGFFWPMPLYGACMTLLPKWATQCILPGTRYQTSMESRKFKRDLINAKQARQITIKSQLNHNKTNKTKFTSYFKNE